MGKKKASGNDDAVLAGVGVAVAVGALLWHAHRAQAAAAVHWAKTRPPAWWHDHHTLTIWAGIGAAVALYLAAFAYATTRRWWRQRLEHVTVDAAAPRLTRLIARLRRRPTPATVGAARIATLRLRPVLKWGEAAEQFVEWPRDDQAAGAPIELRYPEGEIIKPQQIEQCETEISDLVGGRWVGHKNALHSRIVLTRQPDAATLPTVLPYPADHRLVIDEDGEHIPLGAYTDATPFTWVVGDAYPHLLIAGTPGAGKTNALRVAVAGLLRAGCLIDVIEGAKSGRDFKPFATHPAVRVHTTPAGIVDALAGFRAEIARRATLTDEQIAALPRHVILFDEAADTVGTIASYDAKLAESYGRDIVSAARLARFARMSLVLASQRATARALTGDPATGLEIRDNVDLKIGMGPVSDASADLLWGALKTGRPRVRKTDRGRGAVLDGDQFRAVQVYAMSSEEAARVAAAVPVTARFGAPAAPSEPTLTYADPPDSLAHTPLPTPAYAPPTLSLLKTGTADPARAVTNAPKPRYPLTCDHCAHAWTTTAAPGTPGIKCPIPDCRKSKRVPVDAQPV